MIKSVNKSGIIRKQPYSSVDTVLEYLPKKLLFEAKLVKKELSEDKVKKTRNQLNKTKSILLKKIEDRIDAIIDLIELSSNSEFEEEAINEISPEYLLKSLSKEQQEKKKEKIEDVHYFKEKIFDENQDIIHRIFNEKRFEQLLNNIFRLGMNDHDSLDNVDKRYRIGLANLLLTQALNELEYYLPKGYSNLFRQDFQRVREISGIINHSPNFTTHI